MLAVSSGYEFDVDRGPDWLWIHVHKSATAPSATASLADEIKDVVERHFIYRVVLDLESLPKLSGNIVLSSRLIGELIQVHHYILAHDGVLRICSLSPENRAMLEVCGLEDLCLDYHTLDEAVWGHCGPPVPQ